MSQDISQVNKGLRPLRKHEGDWVDSYGHYLQVCVLHELEGSVDIVQAMCICGGMSVCREHMELVAGLMINEYEINDIMEMAYTGTLRKMSTQYEEENRHEQSVQNQEAQTGPGLRGSEKGADSPPENPAG